MGRRLILLLAGIGGLIVVAAIDVGARFTVLGFGEADVGDIAARGRSIVERVVPWAAIASRCAAAR